MKISVLIPYYNQPEYVNETFKSIYAQTRKPEEIVLVDDASKDRPIQFFDTETIEHNCIVNTENKGIGAVRQQLVDNATGDVVAFLSSDDLWMPEFLEEASQMMFDTGADVVYTDYYRINPEGKITTEFKEPHPENDEMMKVMAWERCNAMFSAILIKKNVFDKVKFKPLRRGEDYLWLLEALKDHKFVHIGKPLAKYRIHPAMGTITEAKLLDDEAIRAEARKTWGIKNEE